MTTSTITLNNTVFTLPAKVSDMTCSDRQRLVDAFLSDNSGSLCMTYEINYILNTSYESIEAPYSWDDISNMEASAEYMGEYYTEEEANEKIAELEDERDSTEDEEEIETLQDEIDDMESLEFRMPEIMEWYILDDRLIRELDNLNECTLENRYWGRCCTGQSIVLDYCMQEAVFNIAKRWSDYR